MDLKDKCGVFGVFGSKDASKLCYLGLYALQHRGQEGTGIVSSDGRHFNVIKSEKLVSDTYDSASLTKLKGSSAIGHVRYSTSGSNNPNNIQPLYSKTSKGRLAIAHNGNLTNAYSIYKKLEKDGALFQSTVDSEIFLHLFSRARGKNPVKNIQDTLVELEGAYSLVIMGEGFLAAARDPMGFRPLVLGELDGAYIVCSETCALDLIDATYIREIEPGEIVYITNEGLTSHRIGIEAKPAFCVFEHIYFSRPDSLLFGEVSHDVRKRMGMKLAEEHAVEGDIVFSIPDSGNSAALGYSEASGIPFDFGMTRNHYVGRTFIQPKQKIRNFNVKVKLNTIKSTIKGKRVIVVDDSIVRGTTSKKLVSSIKEAGAKEVHLRISSPAIISPCYMGVDTPTKDQLIAVKKTIDEIRRYIGADSLGYLSVPGLLSTIQAYDSDHFCTSCFTGKYPMKIKDKGNKFTVESKKIKLLK